MTPSEEQIAQAARAIALRPYQAAVFADRTSGLLILHWSRQIGKSYTLAAWAVDRVLSKLAEHPTWLVTVLSNSRDNGSEFVRKCHEVCDKLGALATASDDSPDLKYHNMRMEVHVKGSGPTSGRAGRIKVLAAEPRTARGFSGDLILDEFAFHEDSDAIWEAAEPILSSHPEYLCRIASTGNGRHNVFYRLAAGAGPDNGTEFISTGGYRVRRLSRSAAWDLGITLFDPQSRMSVLPEEARARALDKCAYDQNYECKFNDENQCLLTLQLIQSAQRAGHPVDEQAWSAATLQRLRQAAGDLYVGQDVGRRRDLSVQCVLEKDGPRRRVVALLRLANMRLPDQQKQLAQVCQLPRFRGAYLDMSGLGLGLVEYAQEAPWGGPRIHGINFANTEPINARIRREGRQAEKARVTENMATMLLGAFEDGTLDLCVDLDADALNDLRKPERITSPGGRVSIAAVRDEAGHADHFWALALALRAAEDSSDPGRFQVFTNNRRHQAITRRRDRNLQA